MLGEIGGNDEPLEVNLGGLGPNFTHLRASWSLLEGIFAPTWTALKPTWRQQQLCWDQLRPSWCQLGLSRAILEPIWSLHGAKLGEFCTILCDFWSLLMSLEPF